MPPVYSSTENMNSWSIRLAGDLEDQEGLGLPLAALMLAVKRSLEMPEIQLHKCRAVRERVNLAPASSWLGESRDGLEVRDWLEVLRIDEAHSPSYRVQMAEECLE